MSKKAELEKKLGKLSFHDLKQFHAWFFGDTRNYMIMHVMENIEDEDEAKKQLQIIQDKEYWEKIIGF